TPDAHFFTEVRYKGTKTIAITPDYSEVAKLCDQWLAPKQGTDSAPARWRWPWVTIQRAGDGHGSRYFKRVSSR
ncbi:Respiratory nitrate reductase alpha chain, partial [Salmonella enterica subsp. enterica serovar Uganda str. R8-3404]